MLIASWLHFTPPPPIAHTLCAKLCVAQDRLERRDNHDDRFASPVYLPCITACTLYPLTLVLVLPLMTALQTVQMVIVWTALLTDHIASGVTAEKNIARYRYYPIYANIAQFPITQYRYRSNSNLHQPSFHQSACLVLQVKLFLITEVLYCQTMQRD